MQRALDLLNEDSHSNAVLVAETLTPALFASAPESTKHKLKVKISSLLKSSGATRAYGAVLARIALSDWSVVKSHGASWANIMLHTLELPDKVCWAPTVRTLTFLYTQVHGKPDLSRDVAGAKIGDFMKRLTAVLQFTRAYYAVALMLELYPTQCRPYINKLQPLLHVPGTECAVASLCLAEKKGPEIWRSKVNDILNAENAPHDFNLLREYILVSPQLKVKVPSANLITFLTARLRSLRQTEVLAALRFILDTFELLQSIYVRHFDGLVYDVSETVDMGRDEAMAATRLLASLINAIGWVSENYIQVFTRLTKKILAIATKTDIAVGASGLADYVQNPNAFVQPALSASEVEATLNYLTAVIVNVQGIPQSLRVLVDKFILESGRDRDVVIATLYPGKFSILPKAIHKLPTLDGLQTLTHPRFPPLNISKHVLDSREVGDHSGSSYTIDADFVYNGEIAEPLAESSEVMEVQTESEALHNEGQQLTEESKPLPEIPESVKPARKADDAGYPGKRQKFDVEMTDAPPAAVATPGSDAQLEPDDNVGSERNNDEEDNDEDFVMPTLTLDSD